MNTNKIPKSKAGQPVVTFILIAYNQPELLHASIESIRAQTGEIPFEIIAVDTGSCPPAKSWLASQTDILSIFSHRRQRTLGSQIELALASAQGAYICFLGNGALLYPQTIQTALHVFFEPDKENSLGAVSFLTREIQSGGRFGHFELNSDQFQATPLVQAGLIKKAALEVVGVSDFSNFHDLDQTLRLVQGGYEIKVAERAFAEIAPWPIIDHWMPDFLSARKECQAITYQYGHTLGSRITIEIIRQKSGSQPGKPEGFGLFQREISDPLLSMKRMLTKKMRKNMLESRAFSLRR